MANTTTVACTVALLLGTNGAFGADENSPAAKSEDAKAAALLDEVTVTGTRIKQRVDYVSPNPIQTIDASEIQRLGIVNISDAITRVPSNVSFFTPQNMGGSAFFVGSTLANLRGLNPFFGTRTLTMVDTHRFIPTTQGDSVDLNFIPSNLIERTEIVTGGASAAYGSGAIAGVVNILLNHTLQGFKLDADYGASEHGDGDNYHFGFGGGSDLFDGRAHVIIGGEYQKNDVIQNCAAARDWCGKNIGTISNDTGFTFNAGVPYVPKVVGQPFNTITANVHLNQLSTAGVIVNRHTNASVTSQLNAAGTDVSPFAIGQEGWRALGGNVVGGDGPGLNEDIALYPDLERKTGYGRMSVSFSDSVTGFVEASYGVVTATNHQRQPSQNIGNNCIRADNAFLAGASQAFKNAIAQNVNNGVFANFPNDICGDPTSTPNTPGTLGFLFPAGTMVAKDWSLQDDQRVTTDTKVKRAIVGLDGVIGSSSWTYDTYYQWGKTTRDQIGAGYRTNWRYTFAVDSIIDPSSGKPVCRVTLFGLSAAQLAAGADPSLANGCQPLNVFGTGSASPEALAYAFGNLTEHDNITQNVVAASVSGHLWNGWGAGPLSSALGVEYRVDKLDNDAGSLPFAQRTDFALQYGDTFSGKTKITEGFLELEMPLLRDQPGAKAATINGAIRKARYKNQDELTGQEGDQDITSWKLAAVWDPIDWLRFRGSHSRDLRAASFRELYYSQSIPAGGLFGTVNNRNIVVGGAVQDQRDAAVQILHGNPLLSPETGATTTFGFVLSPNGWAQNMHFSLDYYRIKIAGGQALEQAQTVVSTCFDGTRPDNCAKIVFGTPLPGQPNPLSNITQVTAFYQNVNPYHVSGIDAGWDYGFPLANLFSSAKGNMSFRLQGTYALKTIYGANQVDVAGQTGGDQGFFSDYAPSPNFSGTLAVGYNNGPFTLTSFSRYISAGRLDKQNPKKDPRDPGYDPNLSYSINDATIPSYFVTDLTGSYDFKWSGLEKLNVFLSISNLLDRDPPFSQPNTLGNGVAGVNAVFFDTLGRTYRVGMRMSF
jgi:iron complex outermembrane recepter protein